MEKEMKCVVEIDGIRVTMAKALNGARKAAINAGCKIADVKRLEKEMRKDGLTKEHMLRQLLDMADRQKKRRV